MRWNKRSLYREKNMPYPPPRVFKVFAKLRPSAGWIRFGRHCVSKFHPLISSANYHSLLFFTQDRKTRRVSISACALNTLIWLAGKGCWSDTNGNLRFPNIDKASLGNNILISKARFQRSTSLEPKLAQILSLLNTSNTDLWKMIFIFDAYITAFAS